MENEDKDGQITTVDAPESAAPVVIRSREFIGKKFPEREFADDDEYENFLADYLDNSGKIIADNDKANEILGTVLSEYPELAEIIQDLCNGTPIRIALAKHISPEELSVGDDDTDAESYKKAVEERNDRRKAAAERIKELEQNMEISEGVFSNFVKEEGLDEKELESFNSFLQDMFDNIERGNISREILLKLYQAYKFKEAVADAKEDGLIEGRNEAIEAKREKKINGGDGMPTSGGSVDKPKETTDTMPIDVVDEVLGNSRKTNNPFIK